MKNLFNSYLNIIAAFASIAGIILLSFDDSKKAYLALDLIVFCIILITYKIYAVLNAMIKLKYPDGYSRISTFARYTTPDGRFIDYELYKHIQVKKFILSEYKNGFKWTGTNPPKITSNLQKVGPLEINDGKYDNVCLNFKKPLMYNDVEVINIRMELNDPDEKSSTHLEFKVKDPIQLVSWRVELGHFPSNHTPKALFLRKKIDSDMSEDYSVIESIAFDPHTKSYEHEITNPEVGYYYKLEWERPKNKSTSRR